MKDTSTSNILYFGGMRLFRVGVEATQSMSVSWLFQKLEKESYNPRVCQLALNINLGRGLCSDSNSKPAPGPL